MGGKPRVAPIKTLWWRRADFGRYWFYEDHTSGLGHVYKTRAGKWRAVTKDQTETFDRLKDAKAAVELWVDEWMPA